MIRTPNKGSSGRQVPWPDPARLAFETDFHDTAGVSYAVSPGGQRLYVVKSATEPQVSKLVFVENWIEELKAKVPTAQGRASGSPAL